MVPKISIAIPIYNEEETLRQMLVSATRASEKLHFTVEILLCFNGTTDDGLNIAGRLQKVYPLIKILKSNPGRSKAMKRLIDIALGEIIIFSDADTLVDEKCYIELCRNLENKDIIAVVGNPVPFNRKSFLYNVLNARMINYGSEISLYPCEGVMHKPFIHGRIFAIRRSFFEGNSFFEERFEQAINDDMFLTHLIILLAGRRAIAHEEKAIVRYLPIQSFGSWWQKWVRLWGDLDSLYDNNPEFIKLKPLMKTRLNWKLILKQPLLVKVHFVFERFIHHSGKTYFKLTKKHLKRTRCLRLHDTKRQFQDNPK